MNNKEAINELKNIFKKYLNIPKSHTQLLIKNRDLKSLAENVKDIGNILESVKKDANEALDIYFDKFLVDNSSDKYNLSSQNFSSDEQKHIDWANKKMKDQVRLSKMYEELSDNHEEQMFKYLKLSKMHNRLKMKYWKEMQRILNKNENNQQINFLPIHPYFIKNMDKQQYLLFSLIFAFNLQGYDFCLTDEEIKKALGISDQRTLDRILIFLKEETIIDVFENDNKRELIIRFIEEPIEKDELFYIPYVPFLLKNDIKGLYIKNNPKNEHLRPEIEIEKLNLDQIDLSNIVVESIDIKKLKLSLNDYFIFCFIWMNILQKEPFIFTNQQISDYLDIPLSSVERSLQNLRKTKLIENEENLQSNNRLMRVNENFLMLYEEIYLYKKLKKTKTIL